MKIEEILTTAGVTDEATVAAVVAEMPKHFMPLEAANQRIAAAKKQAETALADLDAYKAEVENGAAAKADESTSELEKLRADYDALKAQFGDAQSKARTRDAMDALKKQLADAGANPAAVGLMANAALSSIEFGEDGKPSNIDAVLESVKTENAALFGEKQDTGKPAPKADQDNDLADAFDEGFGDIPKR